MARNIKDYKFIDKIKNLPYVDEVWLYGSRAREDNMDRSDIDLAIICPKATQNNWIELKGIIDEADTLLKIDCVRFDKEYISEDLYNNIIQDKKVL